MMKISSRVLALVFSCVGVLDAKATLNQENVALSKIDKKNPNLMIVRTKDQNVQLDAMGAFQLCLCAAAQGHRGAQNILESMYRLGRGVALYFGPSREMYSLMAPELGNPSEQYNPGIMLYVQHKVADNITYGLDVNIRNNRLLARLSNVGIDEAFQSFLETGGWQNEYDFRLQWGQNTANPDPELMRKWFLDAAVAGLTKIRRESRVGINSECMELDSNESWKWYTLLAAELGDAKSQSNLGLMCKEGKYSLTTNSVQTFEWLLKAADQNDAEAQLTIVHTYNVDSARALEWYAKAAVWFSRAAAMGDAQALYYLGIMHENGYGMPKNPKKAFELYTQAANKGNAPAQYRLGIMYYNGTAVGEVNFNETFNWFLKAANQGHVIAQCGLGKLYCRGEGVDKNDAKAREWFLKAVASGSAIAQVSMGKMYFFGNDVVARDLAQAKNWFSKAAEQGDDEAQLSLGTVYAIFGDYKSAFEWFLKAANQGNAEAIGKLGVMYCDGRAVGGIDFNKAFSWLSKPAAQENALALRVLGNMYHDGTAVGGIDLEKALECYKKAADKNSQPAMIP